MITEAIEEKKATLEKKKKKLLLEQKIIQEREKRARAFKHKKIGMLAQQANIDEMDFTVLFGAFLEIARNKQNQSHLDAWKKRAEDFFEETKNQQEALIVSFPSEPSKDIKTKLRSLKFKWNSFRKEFQGYGSRKSIETALDGIKHTIERAL